MLPQTTEQKGVAERVLELGAGLKTDKANGVSVLNAVNEIFNNNIYKQNAEKIAEGFRKCSGAKGAADKILRVCNETKY